MNDRIVEKVARAQVRAFYAQPSEVDPRMTVWEFHGLESLEWAVENHWDSALVETRVGILAVIDAIEKPSDAMLKAGWPHTVPGACWRAMIAALRKEIEGG